MIHSSRSSTLYSLRIDAAPEKETKVIKKYSLNDHHRHSHNRVLRTNHRPTHSLPVYATDSLDVDRQKPREPRETKKKSYTDTVTSQVANNTSNIETHAPYPSPPPFRSIKCFKGPNASKQHDIEW